MGKVLLIIDAQTDFCDPKGALYVPGAEQDMARLIDWIEKHGEELEEIVCSFDSHHVWDIAHPAFWENEKGDSPAPFTVITAEDVEKKKWKPKREYERVVNYVRALESLGKQHVIWPEHCLIGTKGWNLYPPLAEVLVEWERKTGRKVTPVLKGAYPYTEHFGIFCAEVPDPNVPETQPNTALLDQLSRYEEVYVSGEALSHCVGTSLLQIHRFRPELLKRTYLLEGTASIIKGFETSTASLLQRLKEAGLRLISVLD